MKKWIIPLAVILCVVALCAGLFLTFVYPWTQYTGIEDTTYHFGGSHQYICYSLNSRTGTLVLFGEGEMTDLTYLSGRSGEDFWCETAQELADERHRIKRLIIQEGITTLAEMMLPGCENAKEVWIPASVTRLENYVFHSSYVETIYFSGDAPDMDYNAPRVRIGPFVGIKTDFADLTIVHLPGAKGFDGEAWSHFNVVEQEFEVPSESPPQFLKDYLLKEAQEAYAEEFAFWDE